MISREGPFAIPNGKAYENTDECWKFLGTAAKAARYLGGVDARSFKDRRSQPAQIFMPEQARPFIDIDSEYRFSLELPDFPELPAYQIHNFTGPQKYMTEIWIEKSTMEDELIPLCRRAEDAPVDVHFVDHHVSQIREEFLPLRVMGRMPACSMSGLVTTTWPCLQIAWRASSSVLPS